MKAKAASSSGSADPTMQPLKAPPPLIPDLSEDVFLLILQYLHVWEVVRCQMVSRAWRRAFSNTVYLQEVLKRYPGAREMRKQDSSVYKDLFNLDWAKCASSIASRYYHLSHGKVKNISRFRIFHSDQMGQYQPVANWEYHESQPGGRLYYENATHLGRLQPKPYLFRPTLWTYADGLLVFAPAHPPCAFGKYEVLDLLDLTTSKQFPVPFSISGKIIRNIRLCEYTLIVEWAEGDPFHSLNDMEQVNRHFVSCYDIERSIDGQGWMVNFRSEFKIHFLGLPLNSRDRFFSTHTATHYAVYFFQPNRSIYTGDEERPIESLFVWDIKTASSYLPSKDPSGKCRPHPAECGPQVVARFPFNKLEFLGVRQHNQIKLMSLQIDSEGGHVKWRENVCEASYGYFDPADRPWRAKTTVFPFMGYGPHQVKRRDGYLPPYRGHASTESCDVEEDAIEKWFVPVMDVHDEAADVRISLVETCFTGMGMEQRMIVRMKVPWLGEDGEYVTLQNEEVVREVSAMGRIAGDERWLIGQNEKMEIVVCRF